MGNADLVTATFCKFIFASLNSSQRLEGEFRNFILTLNLLFESNCFILPLSNKIFWSFLCKFSLVRNCFPFYFERCAQNPAVTSYKGTKEIFCSNHDAFFPLYLQIENDRSKTTQKRSVPASEPKIQLPEKLLFSFQYKVLSAEGGECVVHSSTHLQPNLLHKTSPRRMPSIEDKVRPLEGKFSCQRQNEASLRSELSSVHAWFSSLGILGQPYANSDTWWRS